MKLLVRSLSVDSREPFAVLHRNDCLSIGVDVEDRVRIGGRHSAVLPIMMSDQPSIDGSVFVSHSVMERFGLTEGEMADVVYSPPPESIIAIKKKIDGLELDREEIGSIVSDINEGLLTEREILSFVSAFNVSNASITEVADLTRAMASTGTTVDFGTDEVFDFHSLGGIPGNKITPIVVSIVASKGIVIPKLSSRAISSACGTSDFVETFCDVELSPDRLKDIIAQTKGVFACGNTEYAPVGKEIIRAERPMGIDPRPMMLASIMSKKVALGVKDLLIDIPLGTGSKIQNMDVAEGFSDDLIALGNELGMRLECVVTNAEQPIGRTIGPVLEAWECIKALEDGEGDETLIEKACSMAGILLEMAGIEDGISAARESFESGLAHKKFLEIVKAQGGPEDLRSSDLKKSEFSKDVHAKRDGYVQYIDNQCMVAIAKGAGAPFDKKAGIELLHKKGDCVKEGEVLFRIYADNQAKLDRATESARSRRPMCVLPEKDGLERKPTILNRFR